jgi:hypothetical protein
MQSLRRSRYTQRGCTDEILARNNVTHNRFLERLRDLCKALFRRFDYERKPPEEIEDILRFLF